MILKFQNLELHTGNFKRPDIIAQPSVLFRQTQRRVLGYLEVVIRVGLLELG